MRELLRPAGYLGMIIPNPWLTNIKQGVTRRFVNDNTDIQEIVHFTYPVFKKATVHTEMIVLKRAVSPTSVTNVYIVDSPSQLSNATVDASVPRIIHEQADWRGLNGGVINIFLDAKERQLAGKIAGRAGRLDSFCSINVGVKPYQVGKGTPEQTKETVEDRPFDSDRQATKLHRVILRGTDLRPYVVVPEAVRYLKYGPWLAEPRPSADFNARPKILVRQTGDSLIAAIDADGRLAMNNIHVIVPSNKQDAYWIVALLNSKVLNWYYQTLNPEMGEALAEVKKENVAALPLALSESQDTGTLKRLDHLAKLAETMIDLTRTRESHSHSEFDRDIVARQVAEIRRKVDDLVFELYNLDEAEVQVIERAAERVRTARTEDDEDRGRAFFGTGDELASVMTKPAS